MMKHNVMNSFLKSLQTWGKAPFVSVRLSFVHEKKRLWLACFECDQFHILD